jgi:16S rRNA (guanine(966)-N(2))-methyltransferase RsmD
MTSHTSLSNRNKSQPLRIGGGRFKGRRLQSVPGLGVRPTSGRVRQALFNMLRPLIGNAIFVDLFAGTGSVGLEALSHGARQAFFVERDRRTVAVLQDNIQRCAVADRTTVIVDALPQALQQVTATASVDVLFLDPPYDSDLAETTLDALQGMALLALHGILIWQHAVQHAVPGDVLGRPCWKVRRYGDTQLSLYAHRAVGS